MRRAAIAALVLWLAPPAGAQEPPMGGGRPRAQRARGEVFRVVDAYVAENLQARLGLGDEQTARALPLVRRLHADRRQFAERRLLALGQMRRFARSGAGDDARAAELLRSLRAAEAEERAAVQSAQQALDGVLTPTQQVKYRIFEAEVEHRVRQAMARMRAQRREGGGRPRSDAPPDEEPDDAPGEH
jgi:hypothetical protein